jgi:hypothetical protein
VPNCAATVIRYPNLLSNEVNKAARDFAASAASAYRLSTRRTIISHRKYEIRGLNHLLKHIRKLSKLWKETREPTCKTAVN